MAQQNAKALQWLSFILGLPSKAGLSETDPLPKVLTAFL
jgi:hypothetical protein